MARGRTQSRGDSDGIKKNLEDVSQQETQIVLEDELVKLNTTLRLVLLQLQKITEEKVTEEDIDYDYY